MEDQKKDKIPVKKEDGSFSLIEEANGFVGTKRPEPQPVKPQPIPSPPAVAPIPPVSKSQPAPLTTRTAKPIYGPPIKAEHTRATKNKSDFFYSLDDEEEVRAEKDKLKEFGNVRTETDGERVTKEIIKTLNLSFPEEIIRNRLIAIVNSRLKDIRDFIQTKEMLMRSQKVGGMGYDQDLASKIMDLIEKEATTMHGHPLPKVHKPKTVPPSPPPKPIQSKVIPPQPVAPPVDQSKPRIAEAPRPIVKKQEIKTQPQARQHIAIPSVKRPAFDSERPRMDDIKKPTKVMGPIDEIRELTINDFRRLGENAAARLTKMEEKLDLLQEDSYAKRAEGIAAWRQSPVYKLYLEIGQQSINQNKPVQEIINSRSAQGLSTLDFQEFEVIADFNRILRF